MNGVENVAVVIWVVMIVHVLVSIIRPLRPFRRRWQVLVVGPLAIMFWPLIIQSLVGGETTRQDASRPTETAPRIQKAAGVPKPKNTKPDLKSAKTYGIERAPDRGVSNAESALQLYYMHQRKYDQRRCRTRTVYDADFILCSPLPLDINVPGGLFAVSMVNGKSSITPVNGKAQSFLDREFWIEDGSGRSIPLASIDEAHLRDWLIRLDLRDVFKEFF